ncbi:hypothetical protein ACSBR1_021809 [Camellia fascicularis]
MVVAIATATNTTLTIMPLSLAPLVLLPRPPLCHYHCHRLYHHHSTIATVTSVAVDTTTLTTITLSPPPHHHIAAITMSTIIINPLVFGDYPKIVKKNAGSRIPEFTKVESKLVKGSFDFLGVNHYNTLYIKDKPSSLKINNRDFNADMAVDIIPVSNDTPPDENSTLHDSARVKYLHGFIGSLLNAVRNGSNARVYFTWSFLDVYELLGGYGSCFGLYYVDLDDKDLKRYPKLSAHWYSNFLKGRSSIEVENISALSHQSHFSQ